MPASLLARGSCAYISVHSITYIVTSAPRWHPMSAERAYCDYFGPV
uniref:Uncharacterized protein n=1 Tax=Arundo donax TaxID=35708 RepID=A0A0A9FFQ2_ARUDO